MNHKNKNSYDALSELHSDGKSYKYYDLNKVPGAEKLPFSLKILLENLLRFEDGETVTKDDIEKLSNWDASAEPSVEIAYRPARVLLQDFTGVPAIVDLAAMRDAMKDKGKDPQKINPLQPVELVVDHSVQVDKFGSAEALAFNTKLEYMRNGERYQFLKWGQEAFNNFKVVPPGAGIVHQVNLEYLARIAFVKDGYVYPDTLVGTDSHTTMINGLGVLGWGVGGIEAEAAMLGQPISMLVPKVVGFEISGAPAEGVTATDIVLTVVEMLRNHGVVGKFVEFYGSGLVNMSPADRATIGNMAPEYGATCGIFPIDEETLNYMRISNRSEELVKLTKAYYKAQGMFHGGDGERDNHTNYSERLKLNLADVEPSLAGPKRPQDRVPLRQSKQCFLTALKEFASGGVARITDKNSGGEFELRDGSVVIAAITSCTNTSNPSVMLGAGLLAKKAAELGLKSCPWVKTSLAPGSRVVTEYLAKAGLDTYLKELGFNLVGYGCTTCIGNSGPLPPEISRGIKEQDLAACAVLSGNRNFEGRVHPEVKMNYLASPPLVVAYALAGRMDIDLYTEPLGKSKTGEDVFLKDIWPSNKELDDLIRQSVMRDQFTRTYGTIFDGEENWAKLDVAKSANYQWDDESGYVRKPPFFAGGENENAGRETVENARVLAFVGDSVTTDHISPAGSIKEESPAGDYLKSLGVPLEEFNSYGSRRGNHEVMMRGTFANIRLRNKLLPGSEGGVTVHLPDGKDTSIYDAAMLYQKEKVPCLIIAGKEYGTGSSRDWAAKGPKLLGVRAVIAESFERIHRTNLVGMGILPLQFRDGESAETLKLSGKEVYTIRGIEGGMAKEVEVLAVAPDGTTVSFHARVRIDTPQEVQYYKHGGILSYVLSRLAA